MKIQAYIRPSEDLAHMIFLRKLLVHAIITDEKS